MLSTVAQQLYLAYFGRPADAQGLTDFSAQLAGFLPADATILDLSRVYATNPAAFALVNSFSASQESRDLYTGGTAQFVNSIYLNVLNRPGEADGLNYWVDQIQNKGLDPARAALEIIAAALRNGVRDADTVLRKTEVAHNFTASLNTPEKIQAFAGNPAASAAREILSRVNAETSILDYQGQVDALVLALQNAKSTGTAIVDPTLPIGFGSQVNALFDNLNSQLPDKDFFRFNVQAGELFELVLNSAVASSYRLLGSDGTLITSAQIAGGVTSQAVLKFVLSTPDALLLELSSSAAGNQPYSIGLQKSLDDHVDTALGARSLMNGVATAGVVSSVGDVDVFKLNLQSGVAYNLAVSLPTRADNFTLVVNLLDSNSTLVTSSLVQTQQSLSKAFTVQASGNYLLQVFELNNDNTGNYSLAVTGQAGNQSNSIQTPPGDLFNVDFIYQNGTEAFASFFEQVEARLARVITQGLPNFTTRDGRVIDDLQITVTQRSIDGANGTLAFAGPDAMRPLSQGGLPYLGSVVIDSNDVQNMIQQGALFDVLLHEVMHVLGAGTLWDNRGLIGLDGRYVGPKGLATYRQLTNDPNKTFVPVTSDNGHWLESIFRDELLTPMISFSNDVIFSRLSVAALEDLGYAVDYAQADAFVLPAGVRSAESTQNLELFS